MAAFLFFDLAHASAYAATLEFPSTTRGVGLAYEVVLGGEGKFVAERMFASDGTPSPSAITLEARSVWDARVAAEDAFLASLGVEVEAELVEREGAMPTPDEAKVASLMSGARVEATRVILGNGAPVDVFEAAKRLGFTGHLRVIRGTSYVAVHHGEHPALTS